MAQACPVIGSDQGGIAEAIQSDQTGLLIQPGDAAALADAMRRIARRPGLRTALGSAAYAAAAAELNARTQSAKLENLLLSVQYRS
jgi:glycosyltransferase involved in cell wall biosynthesis